MGKGLETAVVKTAGPEEAAAAGGWAANSHPGSLGKPQARGPGTRVLVLVGFCCLFVLGVFYFFLAVRKQQQKAPPLLRLAQNTWGNPGHRAAEASACAGLRAPENITHASCRAGADPLGALAHTSRGTQSPLLSSRREMYS